MAARHHLRCLGVPELRSQSGEPCRFRTRKHLALLVYLAVEPRQAHRRERLADLLWPRVPALEGRHSVATAISVLRGKFGPEAFEADRDHVRLVYPHLDLDLDRLAAGDVLGDEFSPPLEVAGFLEEFEIADGTEFMLWRDRTQARLLPAIREALVRLMDRCRRTGDFRRIEGLADRMLGIDELCEDAIRAKMEARAFDGDRFTALKIFEGWKTRLSEELGATPSGLVDGIALRLRQRGWERAASPVIPTVRTDHWRGRSFIGRTAEYRTIYEAWEQTRQGTGRHTLILGDSGIGKSTLVGRLMTAAGLEGAATSRVQCYEVEREIPYAAVGTLIRGLLDRPGVSGTPPEWLAELARTVPEVRLRFPAIPPPPESEGESARIRLTEGLHQLLTAISEESPVILVVDDVHLADDASVAVLHLVMRRTQAQQIMVLLTARPGELGRSPSAGRLRECQVQLGMSALDLPPMSDEESMALLAALIPHGESQPGATARRAIMGAAAGYPMVLELLLRDWQANGEKCLALGLGAMTADAGGPRAPEDAYHRLLDRLIHELDPITRNVLNLAAILGSRLNDLSMYALADLSVAQTMTGMTRLTDLRLLRDSGQELEFRNELIRAQAYLTVPSTLRRALHDSIANRLLDAEQQGREVPGLEIAWHCIRCGRADEATPYLLRGAREAMQRGAVHEAERGLATALDHLRDPERSQASLLLAEVLQEQGRWEESLEVLETARLCPSAADQEIAFILRSIAEWRVGKVESTSLEALVKTLARLVQVGATAKTRVKATRVASWIFEDVQDKSGAAIVLNGARSIHIEHLTDQEAGEIAVSKACLAYCTRSGGDYVVALKELRDVSQRLINSNCASAATAHLENTVGCIEATRGQYENAVTHFNNAFRISQSIGNDLLAAHIATNLAMCYGRVGKYHEQLRWGRAGLSIKDVRATNLRRFKAAYQTAWAHAMLGDSLNAIHIIQVEGELLSSDLPSWILQAWHLLVADVLQALGRFVDAKREALKAITLENRVLLSHAYAGPFARWVARLGVDAGEGEFAQKCLGAMLSDIHQHDLIDRAEILNAAVWFQSHVENRDTALYQQMEEALQRLPSAVRDQLDRLGMLGLSEGAPGVPKPTIAPFDSG